MSGGRDAARTLASSDAFACRYFDHTTSGEVKRLLEQLIKAYGIETACSWASYDAFAARYFVSSKSAEVLRNVGDLVVLVGKDSAVQLVGKGCFSCRFFTPRTHDAMVAATNQLPAMVGGSATPAVVFTELGVSAFANLALACYETAPHSAHIREFLVGLELDSIKAIFYQQFGVLRNPLLALSIKTVYTKLRQDNPVAAHRMCRILGKMKVGTMAALQPGEKTESILKTAAEMPNLKAAIVYLSSCA